VNRALSASLRVACGLFILAWAAFAQDTLQNGTFGTGDLTGWTAQGTANVVLTQGGIVPPAVTSQVEIASGHDAGTLDGASNTFADVPFANLNSPLGLAAGAFAAALPAGYTAPTNASAIYQTFTALAGATLSFNWNFATNEAIPTPNDAAICTLLQPGATNALVVGLANSQTSSFTSAGASPFLHMTGYQTVTTTLTTAGSYTLGFISLQTNDDRKSSATYINNVTLIGGSPGPRPTPAPAAWSLGLLGFGFVAIYYGVRRLRRVS